MQVIESNRCSGSFCTRILLVAFPCAQDIRFVHTVATVTARYNDHTGLQQSCHCSKLMLKRYNDN